MLGRNRANGTELQNKIFLRLSLFEQKKKHKSDLPAMLVGSTLKIILSGLQQKEGHQEATLVFMKVWKTLEHLKGKIKIKYRPIT